MVVSLGRLIREGVKALTRKELENLAVEQILRKYPKIRELINRKTSEVTNKCGKLESEGRALSCLNDQVRRMKRELREKFKRYAS